MQEVKLCKNYNRGLQLLETVIEDLESHFGRLSKRELYDLLLRLKLAKEELKKEMEGENEVARS